MGDFSKSTTRQLLSPHWHTLLQRIKLTSVSGHRTPVDAASDADADPPPHLGLAHQQQTGPFNLQVGQLNVNTDGRNNSRKKMHFQK